MYIDFAFDCIFLYLTQSICNDCSVGLMTTLATSLLADSKTNLSLQQTTSYGGVNGGTGSKRQGRRHIKQQMQRMKTRVSPSLSDFDVAWLCKERRESQRIRTSRTSF